eukprot:TRINITY_DN35997_c0_g1_i2.p2 TRINITY_DN35997_c0_g1~~TRINITY_DN35997_c0_g1_i2.p2  ORF type:complete len:103 (+),score=11.93 TRINITY_DN35997_c0_g1_i2:121-429(+)
MLRSLVGSEMCIRDSSEYSMVREKICSSCVASRSLSNSSDRQHTVLISELANHERSALRRGLSLTLGICASSSHFLFPSLLSLARASSTTMPMWFHDDRVKH